MLECYNDVYCRLYIIVLLYLTLGAVFAAAVFAAIIYAIYELTK